MVMFRRLFVLLMLGLPLTVLSARAATSELQDLSRKLFAEADLAFQNRDLEKADSLLTQSLLADPANAEAFFLKGHVSSLNEDPEEGLRLISRGLNINPKDVKARLWAGEAAVSLEDFEEAGVHLERLEKLCGACDEQQALAALIKQASGDADGEKPDQAGTED